MNANESAANINTNTINDSRLTITKKKSPVATAATANHVKFEGWLSVLGLSFSSSPISFRPLFNGHLILNIPLSLILSLSLIVRLGLQIYKPALIVRPALKCPDSN